jgi:hypothetical protein
MQIAIASMLQQLGLDPCIASCGAVQDIVGPMLGMSNGKMRRLQGHESSSEINPCEMVSMCENDAAVVEACTATIGEAGIAGLKAQWCQAGNESLCQPCVEGFAAAGGCPVMLSGGNTSAMIPAGCDPCGDAAEAYCQSQSQNSSSDSDTGPTDTSTSNASVATTEHVTTFTAKLNIGNASDFDQDAYLASIAATTGVGAANVRIKSVTFVVAATYSFAEDVTKADIETSVAANANVEPSQVVATVTTVRRLRSGGERRLAVTALVEISTTDATAADGLKAVANDAAALATKLSEVTGTTIAEPTITVAPAMAVIVETEVVSTSGSALSAPSPADLASEMSTRTGITMTAEITDVVTTTRTTTTTSGITDTESSSASKVLATRALVTGFFALLLNAAF